MVNYYRKAGMFINKSLDESDAIGYAPVVGWVSHRRNPSF